MPIMTQDIVIARRPAGRRSDLPGTAPAAGEVFASRAMMDTSGPRRAFRSRRAGVTMVELLVAMSIFAVLMAGIFTMFISATDATRTGREVSKAYEQGRTALKIMERDLTVAFTARERADTQQFYGRPEGFMFVGRLDATESGSGSNGLSRNTFVLHPSTSTAVFDTTILEEKKVVWGHIQAQLARRAVEAKLASVTDTEIAAAAAAAENLFSAMFSCVDCANDASLYEFNVRVTTNALLHIVESGQQDLDAFDLTGTGLTWPSISPDLPMTDYGNADSFDSSNPDNAILYREWVSAINPFAKTAAPGTAAFFEYDLRHLIWTMPGLNALNTEVIQNLLAAKKREIWMRMLAMDPLLMNSNGEPLGTAYWAQHDATDYILADRILRSAQILDPATDNPVWVPAFAGMADEPMDALYMDGIFRYGDGSGEFSPYFNDDRNITGAGMGAGYLEFITALGTAVAKGSTWVAAVLDEFDASLTEMKESRATAPVLGSPLDARLPYLVAQQFFVMSERPVGGAADVRKWFSQTITLPSGFSRSANTGGQ